MVARGCRKSVFNGYTVSLGENETLLEVDGEDICTTT